MNLGERERTIVKQVLNSIMPEYEVWIFGSRVHGRTLKPFSDVDLAIIATLPIATDRLADLKEAFSESDLPYRVDVVDYASSSQTFRDIIQREHEVIQKPKAVA